MLEQDAGVDRHVVDALLGLVLDHVEKVLRLHVADVVELLHHLVNRHRADRHRRGVDDRLADGVDVAAGRQVHHRVGAEVHGRVQLFQLAVDVAGDGRVADVGVDLGAWRRCRCTSARAALCRWTLLAGITIRPRATSSRISSGSSSRAWRHIPSRA